MVRFQLACRGEPPPVAALAVDVAVRAVAYRVVVKLLGAGGARGALLVVAPAGAAELLSLEHRAAAPASVSKLEQCWMKMYREVLPGAVLLLVLALDD